MELIEGTVKVTLEDIGEGLCGEYNPDDPYDISLLRMDIETLDEEGYWTIVDDGSYCTLIPTETSAPVLEKLCRVIMDRVKDRVEEGLSIKKIGEELSWLCPEDVV